MNNIVKINYLTAVIFFANALEPFTQCEQEDTINTVINFHNVRRWEHEQECKSTENVG